MSFNPECHKMEVFSECYLSNYEDICIKCSQDMDIVLEDIPEKEIENYAWDWFVNMEDG